MLRGRLFTSHARRDARRAMRAHRSCEGFGPIPIWAGDFSGLLQKVAGHYTHFVGDLSMSFNRLYIIYTCSYVGGDVVQNHSQD